jgi:hypothetical protein
VDDLLEALMVLFDLADHDGLTPPAFRERSHAAFP